MVDDGALFAGPGLAVPGPGLAATDVLRELSRVAASGVLLCLLGGAWLSVFPSRPT